MPPLTADSFVLPMPLEADAPFYCMVCGEVFRAKEKIPRQEFKEALLGFVVDHVDLHGGDPEKVPFSIGNMVRVTT
jgi:hypothetical protein